jgi:hypothetical protein
MEIVKESDIVIFNAIESLVYKALRIKLHI